MPETYKTCTCSSTEDELLDAFLTRVRAMSSAKFIPHAVMLDNLRIAQKERTRAQQTEARPLIRDARSRRGGNDLDKRRGYNHARSGK